MNRASLPAGVVLALLLAQPAAEFESRVSVTVDTWQAGSGRAYIGVQAAGEWAPPDTRA